MPEKVLTKAERKIYASLESYKHREEHGLFMAQGTKCVTDTVDAFSPVRIVCTKDWLAQNQWAEKFDFSIANNEDLERITTMKSTPPVIAIYKLPESTDIAKPADDELSIALDCIQDPGNLGTIMRVCDWMGVRNVYASHDTVDVWSPKVVQATMGAISRVKVSYVDLPSFLKQCTNLPIYGTFLDGESIYKSNLPKAAIVVMGNEGKGISKEVAKCVSKRFLIPSYPQGQTTSESLNVAVATAITLSEFRRNG